MKTKLAILALIGVTGIAFAAPQTFDFKDPKGINNAGFKLDAPLEAINGNASGISGTVTFDLENPGVTQGKIIVATGSLMLPNPMQKQHMLGDKWLDATKFPEISFESKAFKNVKTTGDATTADVTGTFTLKDPRQLQHQTRRFQHHARPVRGQSFRHHRTDPEHCRRGAEIIFKLPACRVEARSVAQREISACLRRKVHLKNMSFILRRPVADL
jgi:polyisoprenoid-binding protein YceI